jgi:hypothetical protein
MAGGELEEEGGAALGAVTIEVQSFVSYKV